MENDPKATEKINKLIGWAASGAITLVVSICWFLYNNAESRIANLEERVSFLYQDKVSRAEFREEMTQIRLQNDANKTDIIARQESLKSDILARIDLLLPYITNRDRAR